MFKKECDAAVTELRREMSAEDFSTAWAEGAMLSTEDAIAYAQRRREERKRPSGGWESLPTTERDVVELVAGGLGNKEIADRAAKI